MENALVPCSFTIVPQSVDFPGTFTSYSSNAPSLFTAVPARTNSVKLRRLLCTRSRKPCRALQRKLTFASPMPSFNNTSVVPIFPKLSTLKPFTRVQHASNRHPSQDCGRERMKWKRTAPKCSNNCSLQGKSQSTRTTKCSRSSLTSV